MAHLGNSIFVVGIDFGTTYTRCAFASKPDFESDPPKFHTISWSGSKKMSLKAPTAVLLDSNMQLVSFGYEAENKFSELLADDETEDYYYFHQFKMLLHNQRVTRKTTINDISGKSIEAIKVFYLAIRFLKDQLSKEIQQRLKSQLTDDDLYFILTVPALWDDAAKQFMREAAQMAGIRTEKLSIAFEPEATSIYCQTLKTELSTYFHETVKAGQKYMVIDLGGRTTDITVHQLHPNGFLHDVVQPCSEPWGGQSIDEAFYNFLCEICGPKAMTDLKETEPEDYIDLFREFETKKRSITTKQANNVVITIPVSLLELVKEQHENFENAVENCKHKMSVIYARQKIHILPKAFRNLFKRTIDEVLKHVDKLLKHDKLSDLKTILLVGGFSECDLVQDAFRKKIGASRKLIIPEEAGSAVLKGAVLFGHEPGVVSQRIARNTYGIPSSPDWDPDMHPEAEARLARRAAREIRIREIERQRRENTIYHQQRVNGSSNHLQ